MNNSLDEKLYKSCKSACANLEIDDFWWPYNLDFETLHHSFRVCLYSISIGKFLGINKNKNLMKAFAEASLEHDYGKADVEGMGVYPKEKGFVIQGRPEERYSFVNKKTGFTDEDKKKMNDHIDIALLFLQEEPMRTIIAYHHSWQKNPVFPRLLKICKRTKETDYLSKLLAIIDFYDAASERENTRNTDTPRKLSSDEVHNLILEEYKNLKIFYNGRKFPKIKTTGEKLINNFYDAKIFGSK